MDRIISLIMFVGMSMSIATDKNRYYRIGWLIALVYANIKMLFAILS